MFLEFFRTSRKYLITGYNCSYLIRELILINRNDTYRTGHLIQGVGHII